MVDLKNGRVQTIGEAVMAIALAGLTLWLAVRGEAVLAVIFGVGSATYVGDILRRARKRRRA